MKLGLIVVASSLLLLSGCASLKASDTVSVPAAPVEVLSTAFVPDVSGLNGEEAAAALSARGLNFIFLVNGVSVSPSASQSVVSQDITPGFEVAAAATITVVVIDASAAPSAPEPAPAPEPVPVPAPVEPAPVEPAPVEPAPAPEPVPAPAEPAPLPPYQSCAEVKADGADPIYSDNPRWNSSLDRDSDQMACE